MFKSISNINIYIRQLTLNELQSKLQQHSSKIYQTGNDRIIINIYSNLYISPDSSSNPI